MLENVKYNLGREYKFYATIPPDQRKQRRGCSCYKKRNSTQKTKHKNNLPGGISGGLPGREKKKNNMLNISTPTDLVTGEDMRDLLEHLAAPMILQINNRPNTY